MCLQGTEYEEQVALWTQLFHLARRTTHWPGMQGIWVPGALPMRVADKEAGGKKFKAQVQEGYPNITPSILSFFRDGKGNLATVRHVRIMAELAWEMMLFLVQLSSPGSSTGLDPKAKVKPMRFVNTPLPGYDPVEVVDLTRKYTQGEPKVLF